MTSRLPWRSQQWLEENGPVRGPVRRLRTLPHRPGRARHRRGECRSGRRSSATRPAPTAPMMTWSIRRTADPRSGSSRWTSRAPGGLGAIHVAVWVPHDQAESRVAAALAAGGRMVRDDFAPRGGPWPMPPATRADISTVTGRDWPRATRRRRLARARRSRSCPSSASPPSPGALARGPDRRPAG